MRTLGYKIERTIVTGQIDVALMGDDEDPVEMLISAVVDSIAIDVEVTVGGITMHLAAWADPEHWADDWALKGIENPREFLASLVVAK